jgi:hypothetical protein
MRRRPQPGARGHKLLNSRVRLSLESCELVGTEYPGDDLPGTVHRRAQSRAYHRADGSGG